MSDDPREPFLLPTPTPPVAFIPVSMMIHCLAILNPDGTVYVSDPVTCDRRSSVIGQQHLSHMPVLLNQIYIAAMERLLEQIRAEVAATPAATQAEAKG